MYIIFYRDLFQYQWSTASSWNKATTTTTKIITNFLIIIIIIIICSTIANILLLYKWQPKLQCNKFDCDACFFLTILYYAIGTIDIIAVCVCVCVYIPRWYRNHICWSIIQEIIRVNYVEIETALLCCRYKHW